MKPPEMELTSFGPLDIVYPSKIQTPADEPKEK